MSHEGSIVTLNLKQLITEPVRGKSSLDFAQPVCKHCC